MKKIGRIAIFGIIGALLAFFASIGLMTFLFFPNWVGIAPQSGAEAAGWVQAIGSIVAIAASYFVGAHQARKTHESALALYELDRKRIHQGSRAVVYQLIREARGVEFAAQGREPEKFRHAWLSYIRPGIETALQAFDAMPKYELGEVRFVQAAFEVRSTVAQLMTNVQDLMNTWPPSSSWAEYADDYPAKAMEILEQLVDSGADVIDAAHERFNRAVAN